MTPAQTGKAYNKIAAWWQQQHQSSHYGVSQLQRALTFLEHCTDVSLQALDVGCGAGGRMISPLENAGFTVTGVDISAEMIALATAAHPAHTFHHGDICEFQPGQGFDLILAWDSLFHLPLAQQEAVLVKLCQALSPNGVLLYTFGHAVGEHTDTWRGDTFYYSSLGINENLRILREQGLTPVHLELDQYPEKHVVTIAQKT